MKYSKPITSWDEVPIVMDITMAARIVEVTPETLIKRCQRGTFPGYKEGKFWRFEKEAVREHMKNSKTTKSTSNAANIFQLRCVKEKGG